LKSATIFLLAGSLLRSLNDDTAAYQQAVSERLGIFIQHMTTFIVGFAVAFWRGRSIDEAHTHLQL